MEVTDLGTLAKDNDFLNTLQEDTGKWILEIQKVTKLERDPSSGTALQEINFWLSKEIACHKIAEQLKELGIGTGLAIASHAALISSV